MGDVEGVLSKDIYISFFGLNISISFMNIIVIILSRISNIIGNNILMDTDCGGGLLYS